MVTGFVAKVRLSFSDAAQARLSSAFQRWRQAQSAAARPRIRLRHGADGEGVAHYVGRRTDGTGKIIAPAPTDAGGTGGAAAGRSRHRGRVRTLERDPPLHARHAAGGGSRTEAQGP